MCMLTGVSRTQLAVVYLEQSGDSNGYADQSQSCTPASLHSGPSLDTAMGLLAYTSHAHLTVLLLPVVCGFMLVCIAIQSDHSLKYSYLNASVQFPN